jgi:hypothetical protein
MNDLAANLKTLLVRELNAFSRELDLFPDDETVWKAAPGVTNSAANLALHVAGNLQHFVGAGLGKTGYVRNRELEFSRSSGTRVEIKQEIEAAIRAVESVLPSVTDEVMAKAYPLVLVEGKQISTGLFLQQLCSHASFHLGQAGYLRRLLTGDARSAGPMSLPSIMSPA